MLAPSVRPLSTSAKGWASTSLGFLGLRSPPPRFLQGVLSHRVNQGNQQSESPEFWLSWPERASAQPASGHRAEVFRAEHLDQVYGLQAQFWERTGSGDCRSCIQGCLRGLGREEQVVRGPGHGCGCPDSWLRSFS